MQQKPPHALDRRDRNQLFRALEFCGKPEKIAEDYKHDVR
jgi:hypothetical protein